jgi:MoxR-like ATPase
LIIRHVINPECPQKEVLFVNPAYAPAADDLARLKETAERFRLNVGKVIVGKQEAIDLIFVALLCEGHVLIEDVPGVGKTLLAKAAARSLNCTFKRIQCTPDLLPSDVVGIQFFNQKNSEFEFRPGPIIANIVLVDEINRAMPRTQSSLLECMQERQVTVDLKSISLPRPFMLIATQNPIELEGTFPLPEAQLDRFLLKAKLGYPSAQEESDVLSRFQYSNPLENLSSIIEISELLELQNIYREIFVEETVRDYVVRVNRATRENADIRLGTSTRAALGLQSASQAMAGIQGRGFVIPDDVKTLALPVLSHRIIVKTAARLRGRSEEDIIREILSTVPVPTE